MCFRMAPILGCLSLWATVDYQFVSVNLSGDAIGSCSVVDVTVVVQNIGIFSAPETELEVAYGNFSQLTGLFALDRETVPALGPFGISPPITIQVTLPPQVLPGLRYIHVALDPDELVSEVSEENNRTHRTFTITGLPDLTPGTTQFTSIYRTYTEYDVNYQVINQGETAVISCITQLYFSADSFFDPTDILVAEHTLPFVPAGGTSPLLGMYSLTFTLPCDVPLGNSRFFLLIDGQDQREESDETNNMHEQTMTVLPDVELALNTAQSQSIGLPGDLVQIQLDVENRLSPLIVSIQAVTSSSGIQMLSSGCDWLPDWDIGWMDCETTESCSMEFMLDDSDCQNEIVFVAEILGYDPVYHVTKVLVSHDLVNMVLDWPLSSVNDIVAYINQSCSI